MTKEKEFKTHKVVLACQSAFFEITDVKKSSAWTEERLKNTNKDLLMEVLEHVVKTL